MMQSNGLQQSFFRHIKSLMPANISLADTIAELLNISNDSAYRRIRGEKPITFDEIQVLCRHFSISLDKIMNLDSNSVVFLANNVDDVNFRFENYLSDMLATISGIRKADNKRILYEAKDMPIFYHFLSKELAAFKFFFWMKTVLFHPAYSNLSYEDNELVDIVDRIGGEIVKIYMQVPSAEIWSVDSLNTTIRQIEYCRYAGIIKKAENVDMLFNELSNILAHVKEQAGYGEKFMPGTKPTGTGPLQLFCNDVFLGNNTVIAEVGDASVVFINHGIMNYMINRDKAFCDYTKHSLEGTIKLSQLISSVNEKERNRFFNTLQKKIDDARVAK